MARSLVVCIGNDLVADDAVGHSLYHLLKKVLRDRDVRLCLLGVGGMAVVDELDGEELLVVVDAVQFGAAPGTVHVLNWEQIPITEIRPVSGHGIGIREALQVCRKLYPEKVPQEIYLVGVEGACFDMVGSALSSDVKTALPRALEAITQLIH
jgi:hydrogenase maturation protease